PFAVERPEMEEDVLAGELRVTDRALPFDERRGLDAIRDAGETRSRERPYGAHVGDRHRRLDLHVHVAERTSGTTRELEVGEHLLLVRGGFPAIGAREVAADAEAGDARGDRVLEVGLP